jgi:hypothetical protein
VSDKNSDVCLAHLVWAPLGSGPLERFLTSCARHPAGIEHRLAVICNGFSGADDPRLSAIARALAGIEHELVLTPRPVVDLAAYRQAATELEAGTICFLNSYSRPLADRWLSKLLHPLADPAVGLVGASASFESAYSSAPFWLRPLRRRMFGPFPSPHVRTNGFAIDRRLLLDLKWPPIDSKVSALAFEGGHASLTQQVRERGLDVMVVGADGIAYPAARWRESATFRAGGQRNLLIADNRTDQYEQADPRMRLRLEQMAWG